MISIVTCLAAVTAACIAPRLLVLLLAMLMAASLSARLRRTTCRLLADGSIRHGLNYDRRTSRAERRLIRKSLCLALDQVELRSLFPSTVASVDRWTVSTR